MATTALIKTKKIGKQIGIYIAIIGAILLSSFLFTSEVAYNKTLFLSLSLGLIGSGVLVYTYYLYVGTLPGIKNNGVWFSSISSTGILAWIAGVVLTLFYVALYWYPHWLGLRSDGKSTGLVALFDPLSVLLNGKAATQWFVYGTLYTFSILIFGVKYIVKYRHSRYQIIRTCSVMFFQLSFAFLIPEILSKLNSDLPYFGKDLKNMWPLNYYFFESWHLKNLLNSGGIGLFFLIFGIAMIFVISPILTYFFGKRWYCSWVCGCGALAETAGDSFRQLSSKKVSVWKIERWLIHTVLVFAFITTIALIWSFIRRNAELSIISGDQFIWGIVSLLIISMVAIYLFKRKDFSKDALYSIISIGIIIIGILCINYFSGEKNILFINSYKYSKWYGFFIGAAFSGIIGVGFYPILGGRVWCRFGCPMAAILGFQQRILSRFRITTNGGQCISCGNCSTYCEMGIDVRSYAQKGQNIVRSSCVGCGVCSAVCPRGVLNLENSSMKNRINNVSNPLGSK